MQVNHLIMLLSWNGIQCKFTFYPRPVLAFGYCHRLGCVCVCVNFFVRAITHLTFQLESSNLDQKIQQILLKVPIVFGVDWPWPSRSNLTSFQNSVYLHPFCVLKYLWDLHKNGSFLNCCPAQMIPHICVYTDSNILVDMVVPGVDYLTSKYIHTSPNDRIYSLKYLVQAQTVLMVSKTICENYENDISTYYATCIQVWSTKLPVLKYRARFKR